MEKKNKVKPGDFQKIANYAFKTEAEIAVDILKKAGIPSLLKTSGASSYAPESSSTGFSLLVLRKDAEKALGLIPCSKD